MVFGGSPLAASYEVTLTNRRFGEAETLIASDNTAGLTELQTAISVTAEKIQGTDDPAVKQQFISNLAVYNQKLEEKKQEIAPQSDVPPVGIPNQPVTPAIPAQIAAPSPISGAPTTPAIPATSAVPAQPVPITPTVAPPPVQPPPVVTTPSPAAEATVVTITQTQKEITQTIKDLEKPAENKEEKDKNSGKKEENKKPEKKDNRESSPNNGKRSD